jgi:hypothetical protein
MKFKTTPPVVPIKVTSGYHATGAIPIVEPAKLEHAAFPLPVPASIGFFKDIGNQNTGKLAALDAADATQTFKAAPGSSVEQAVIAAALLAKHLPSRNDRKNYANMRDQTASYVVLAAGDDLYVTPLWNKTLVDHHRVGGDVDWRGSMSGGNAERGTAARASDPMFVAAVGKARWIDTRGTYKPA